MESVDAEKRNWSALVQVDRTNLQAQEYHARLAGRLDNVIQVNVQVVVPIPTPASTERHWDDDGLTLDIRSERIL